MNVSCKLKSLKLCNSDDCKICFEKSFASSDKAKYWSDKNIKNIRYVFKKTTDKYLFNCDKCNHEFITSPNNISKDSWCSYCGSKKLCDKEDCKICFNRSFASVEYSKYWSKENEITPRFVFKSSNVEYKFDCKCGHSFFAMPNIFTHGTNCIYCNKNAMKLCDKEDCKMCFERSFASHEKAKYWSDTNEVNPRQMAKGSDKAFNFLCDCGHIFKKQLCSITGNLALWCPYCANQKLCDKEDCDTCFNRSFASSEFVLFFSEKNIVKPRQVFKKTPKKYILNCNKCDKEFTMAMHKLASGQWCSCTINKTEEKLFNKLVVIYSSLERQGRFEWCRSETNNRYYPFDFVLNDEKIIIELDGEQHFKQIRNWDSPEDTIKRDKYKMKKANENNYSIIRILQTDVFSNKYDWISELSKSIEELKTFGKVKNIFLCKNNEYNIFNGF